MKSGASACVITMTLFSALAVPVRLAAQEQQQQTKKLPRYTVTDLGTFGGTIGGAQGINEKGWVAGFAFLTGNTAQHVFLWQKGLKTDLGTLGGPNSTTFGPGLARNGSQVVGAAETSTADPLGEDFCHFGTHLVCLPFGWQNGLMTPLPTLGGNNGTAYAINNLGQVAGVAENTTLDSTCPSPEYQSEPVIWENGAIQELPTVSGDPDGLAVRINDNGQAVGGSGDCYAGNTFSLHALLWQNGTVTDLGNLGGTLYSIGNGINDKGQVTGASDLPGDTNFFAGPISNAHPFVWQSGAITDLGTLPGDAVDFGYAINNNGQVVGVGSRAFLWQDGVMTDLNTLVPGPPFSPLYLLQAYDINDLGEIVGLGVAITGEQHAFLAIPCDAAHSEIAACQDTAGATAAVDPAPAAPLGQMPDRLRNPQFPGRRLPRPGSGPTSHF